jgi:hypothetical protein
VGAIGEILHPYFQVIIRVGVDAMVDNMVRSPALRSAQFRGKLEACLSEDPGGRIVPLANLSGESMTTYRRHIGNGGSGNGAFRNVDLLKGDFGKEGVA